MRSLLLIPALAAVVAAGAVHAQDAPADSAPPPPNGLRQGAWSLTLEVPTLSGGNSGELGAWKMVDGRTNLGVTVNAFVGKRDTERDTVDGTEVQSRLGMGLNARRYLSTAGPVAPYVQGQLSGGGARSRRTEGSSEITTDGLFASVYAAVGAEWFPTPHFSVGGHTGISVTAGRYEAESAHPGGRYGLEERDRGLSTFTSSLTLRIYF